MVGEVHRRGRKQPKALHEFAAPPSAPRRLMSSWHRKRPGAPGSPSRLLVWKAQENGWEFRPICCNGICWLFV